MYLCVYECIFRRAGARPPERSKGSKSYMLNMQVAESNTVLYSCIACFVNTATLNMHVFMSYTGLHRAECVIRILMAAYRNT